MADIFQNNTVTHFPDISKINFKSIEKKYLKVILLNIGIVFTILFVAAFMVDYKNLLELKQHSIGLYLIVFIMLLITLFVKIVGFKKRKYAVREKDISYKKGLFFRTLTTVPFNRIQHVEIDQGPISRYFNLVTLSVFTAGDSSDDLKISGLVKEEAVQIKEFISNQIDG
ncbi:PH domain-containing protein [Polaribacter batillariae]|uniref:PH domain-containing protein n=1 Tax=Polaribacter batillariae TaxID=2808900 RepID=A0ABX7SUP4_9FLAO|nr:PH domain-containing protein [Polaribacter batillariae]QTD37384.1 PH domain-containing protein [Polaribacter batillariae]